MKTILPSDGNTAIFAITDTKLHVPTVTLSTKDSASLAKQLNDGFERSVYWDSYETNPAKVIEQGKNLCELLNASFQGLKRLFVLAYSIADGGNDEAGIKNNRKYFLLDLINSMMKSGKYQQCMEMILQLVVYWIMHILKTITN